MSIENLFDEFPGIHLKIRNDFGKGFFFRGRTSGITEAWIDGLRKDHREDLPEKYRGCLVTIYTGGNYRKVVRLSLSIPTFDSGDREWDSWHDLYLVCPKGDGPIYGAYVTCGYRIALLVGFREMVCCPDEVRKLLD